MSTLLSLISSYTFMLFIVIILLIIKFVLLVQKKLAKLKEGSTDIQKTMINFINSFSTFTQLNFIDYKETNFFNEIYLKFPENSNNNEIKLEIKSNIIYIPIFEYKNKNIYDVEIILSNSNKNQSKVFRISIYKNFINNVNIYLNNNLKKYFSSDIIFYGDINKINLNNYTYNTFNFQKRLRCLILNAERKILFNIIKNNNYDNKINSKIEQILSDNFNINLLINIFIGNNTTNILIFGEEKNQLIRATEDEKILFSKFYDNIRRNINDEKSINEYCILFQLALLTKTRLFGNNIETISIYSIIQIIINFLNQGFNCLLHNNIINENDNYFIYGCLIFLLFVNNNKFRIKKSDIKIFNNIIEEIKDNGFDSLEQIKAAIAYVSFYIANPILYTLEITKNLDADNPYKKGFNFYKSIIEDLNEESELMLIFLQLNSGSGREKLNNENCYKISMIPISEIKEHLINNIPKYFFYYNDKNGDNIAMSESKTQILGFNEQSIFLNNDNNNNNDNINDNNDDNNNDNNNAAANVLIGMFHEGGHQKFHMDIKKSYKKGPFFFIDKTFSLVSQEILNIKDNNDNIRGESGICIDCYLYNFYLYPAQIILKSSKSHKLWNKSLFTNKLDKLNEIASKIINDFLQGNQIILKNPSGKDDMDALKNIIKILKKDNEIQLNNNNSNVKGGKYFSDLGVYY